ncbi:HEAT repeat domain-containing protein [Prochlorothrix hollandica]|uniref:HEAT repeat domain-containing protein n=1 Tax=Prochlorothrix hollandica TaxID=1223 RepID=UPI00333F3928
MGHTTTEYRQAMDLEKIELHLSSADLQERLRATTALRAYGNAVAVPLLCSRIQDPEFIVRSLVAMILGHKRTAEGFSALTTLLQDDPDATVRAEAVHALSHFGQSAIDHLMAAFRHDQHWLVRRSIIATLLELPLTGDRAVDFFNLCTVALRDSDVAVQEVGVEGLAIFATTPLRTAALDKLIPLVKADHWQTRMAASRALQDFDNHQAREALVQLRQDPDHRVVGGALEGLVD